MWCEMILWASNNRRRNIRRLAIRRRGCLHPTRLYESHQRGFDDETDWKRTRITILVGGRARRRRERIKSERAFLRTKQHRERTKIQNRGSNPLGFFSTSMSPSRATLDQKHGPSSLPHAFCFFLLFCLHYSLSLLRKKNRLILSLHKCDRIV